MRRKSLNGLIYDFTHKYADLNAYKYRPDSDIEKALFDKYVMRSFLDLYKDILKMHIYFKKNNINDFKVAVFGRNSYIWSLITMSSLTTSNIIVPVDKELKYNETESSFKRAEVDIIFYDEKFEKNILEISKKLNIPAISFLDIKKYIFSENPDFNFEKEDQNFKKNLEDLEKKYTEYEKTNAHEIIKDTPKDFEKDINSLEDVKVLLFTSGTTAMSKLVLITRENLITNVYDVCEHEELPEKGIEISLLPTHHIFGLTCILVLKNIGIETTYPDSLKKLSSNFKEYKVSIFVGVPLILEAIYDRIKKVAIDTKKWKLLNIMRKISNFLLFFKIDLRRKIFKSILDELGGNLEYIISGAAAINPEVKNFFRDIGIKVFPGYGLSETSPVVAAEKPGFYKNGSVGVKVENVEVKIDTDELIKYYENTIDLNSPSNKKMIEELKQKGEGEILIRGKSVFKGYFKDLDKTKEAFYKNTHWFKTGDVGYIDEDNFIFITGRMKDMIVLPNGKKAFPEEIEYIINKSPYILDSFVFASNKNIGFGSNGDLKIYAKIQYDPNDSNLKNKTDDEIYNILWEYIKEVNKTLPSYKYIKGILITKEPFVKTTTKKIKRFVEKEKIEKEFN